MAIAARTSPQVDHQNTSGNLALTVPAGWAAGDLLLLTLAANTPVTIGTPTGFTQIGAQIQATSSGTVTLAVFYKVAVLADIGSVITCVNPNNSFSGVLTGYTGVDNNNPIASDQSIAQGTDVTNTSAVASLGFLSSAAQAESAYRILCGGTRATAASRTITSASSGYTVDAQVTTTAGATAFILAAVQDANATLANVPGVSFGNSSPLSNGSATLSGNVLVQATKCVALRSVVGASLGVDYAFSIAASSPVTVPAVRTGYTNSYALLMVSAPDIVAITSVTFATTGGLPAAGSWTLLASSTGQANVQFKIWGVALVSAISSNATVVVTQTGGSAKTPLAGLWTFRGVGTPSTGQAVTASGSSAAVSATLTTQFSQSLVYGGLATSQSLTGVLGSDFSNIVTMFGRSAAGQWATKTLTQSLVGSGQWAAALVEIVPPTPVPRTLPPADTAPPQLPTHRAVQF